MSLPPNRTPGIINLTPTSDSRSNGGLYSASTRASVDSDSDYQAATLASTTPSRPLSRSSTLSGLSTTATKDGIEGKRLHRFHDPLGYTTWVQSMTPSTNQSDRQDDDDDEDDDGMNDDNNSDDPFRSSTPQSSQNGMLESIDMDQDEDRDSSYPDINRNDSDINFPDGQTPPNVPSAPPVTLNEKIRLLRTGSVSKNGLTSPIDSSEFDRQMESQDHVDMDSFDNYTTRDPE